MSFCNNKFHSNLLSQRKILSQVIRQSRPLLNDSKIDFRTECYFYLIIPSKRNMLLSGAVFMLISGAHHLSRNAGLSLDSFKQVSENGKGNWEAGKADQKRETPLLSKHVAAHILSCTWLLSKQREN